MKGAVGYFRVSTKEQAAQNNSLPVQEGKFKNHCTANGLPALCTFLDKQSARTDKRPEFQRMLDYCQKNHKKISHVIVADLSRFARNVTDQGTAIFTLKQLGIDVVSVDEPITDDTAAGKLARNMLGAMNQFFSDSLSEKTKYRMEAGVKAGRWLWVAPLGYLNEKKSKTIVTDPERAPLVRKAFELIAESDHKSSFRLTTAMGLTTRSSRPVPKQTFSRMIRNEFYAGWITNNGTRIKGTHDPLISEELFARVQAKLSRGTPHKQVNEDFPLRGFVRCAGCGTKLTAGMAKGRTERYARYWCWQKGCVRPVGVSRNELEAQFKGLLSLMGPTAEFLAQMPLIAAREWEARKGRIAKDSEVLSRRLAEQTALNQKLIRAKLQGEISAEDFQTFKASITAETARINEQIIALDAERCTMQDLCQQAEVQTLDLVLAWERANANQRQELVRGLFPEGLHFSHEKKFFEPANTVIRDMQLRWLESFLAGKDDDSLVGVPDGI